MFVVAAWAALATAVGSFESSPAFEGDAMATEVQVGKVAYLGWKDAYELDNGIVKAVVVSEIGPRIIDFRLSHGDNVLHVRGAEAGGKGESNWVFRGGWRLWVTPERKETTYALDNSPCQVEIGDDSTLRVTGPPQDIAGIQKRIEVRLARGEPRLHVESRIRNIGDRQRTYAPWSLSVMRPGGRAFVPLDVGPLDAFDSVRRLMLWSYAEMSDPRYTFGDRLVQINQSLVAPPPAGVTGRGARTRARSASTPRKAGRPTWSAIRSTRSALRTRPPRSIPTVARPSRSTRATSFSRSRTSAPSPRSGPARKSSCARTGGCTKVCTSRPTRARH